MRGIRVWDVHAVLVVITQEKKGYAFHPEVQRWRGLLDRLVVRHDLLVGEMTLRGYKHRSPMVLTNRESTGGELIFLDPPEIQFRILAGKYGSSEAGRVPLPKRCNEFWAQHKYSIMARGYDKYKDFSKLSAEYGSRYVEDGGDFIRAVYASLAKNRLCRRCKTRGSISLDTLRRRFHQVYGRTGRRWYLMKSTG